MLSLIQNQYVESIIIMETQISQVVIHQCGGWLSLLVASRQKQNYVYPLREINQFKMLYIPYL